MIGYAIAPAELIKKIIAADGTWLKKAGEHKVASANGYLKHTPFWGDIKSVFMELQNNKCAYCERVLEGGDVAESHGTLSISVPRAKLWHGLMMPLASRPGQHVDRAITN